MRSYTDRNRALVTGGAGFLGSHVINKVLARGGDILRLDNLFTHTKRNIDQLRRNRRFEFVRHDVTFPNQMDGTDQSMTKPGRGPTKPPNYPR